MIFFYYFFLEKYYQIKFEDPHVQDKILRAFFIKLFKKKAVCKLAVIADVKFPLDSKFTKPLKPLYNV